MKLYDIVKQCQTAGLKVSLQDSDSGGLLLSGETQPGDINRAPQVLVWCDVLGGQSSERYPTAKIKEQIAKAISHPDCVAQRKWDQEFKKLCEDSAKERAEKAANAAT